MRTRALPIMLMALMISGGRGVSTQGLGQEEKFTLQGRVINAVTAEPVGGALVEVYAGTRRALFSAADGRFEFAGLPRGTCMLNIRKPGYFNDRDLGAEPGGMFNTYEVPSDHEVELKLTPEGIISGHVEDEKGRPLESVSVQPEMWVVSDGTKRLQPGPGLNAQTDDEGNFRIAELPPGDYYLKFSEPGGGGVVFRDISTRPRRKAPGEADKGKQGYGTQYYPGVTEEALASGIHVRAGVEVPIGQVLEPLRLYELAGVVRGAPNGEGFQVMLVAGGSSGGEPRGKTQVFPSTGEFRIEAVPQGKYLLTAMAQDPTADRFNRRPSQLMTQSVVDVNSDMSGLTLLLGHGATIGVRLYEETIKTGDSVHQVQVSLQSAEFPQVMQQVMVPPPANDMRSPRGFENVAPGTYTVETWPEGPGYVASIRCAGVDLLKDDLKVAAGASFAPIEVRVRNDGAELNLTAVENGKPVSGRVIVYSEEYPKRSTTVMTWPTSITPVQNLPPGTYKLIATRGTRELEFRNPAVMATYLAHATAVTVGPEAKINVQVEVQEVVEP